MGQNNLLKGIKLMNLSKFTLSGAHPYHDTDN